jgi:predicted ATPase/DNA-binding winged helix-turn-helix (wHTH) protein
VLPPLSQCRLPVREHRSSLLQRPREVLLNFPKVSAVADTGKIFLFGPFELVPNRRALHAHGQDVHLRGRAFDLLLALVERRERVVSKDELMDLVWGGRIVEEGNLTVHVAALRKLLGSGSIATISGRGYRFVAPLEEIERLPPRLPGPAAPPPGPPATPRLPDAAGPPGRLPRLLTRIIGRAEDLDQVEAQFRQGRLLTVLGPGGIGKSTLALAAAERLRGRFPDGIWVAEFGPIEDPALVPETLAAALGLQHQGGDLPRSIALLLADKRGLLVLDGCEHMLQAIAALAETVLRSCPDIAVLATSREPLRAEGERLHRLGPLGMAAPAAEVTADRLAQFPAADLFLERAGAVLGRFVPTDAEARAIMEICRQLDGIPLAIELAAAMLQVITVADLRARLDARFDLLTAGRRTALPRQQTLRAAIGWSFDLLPPDELDMLQRLSAFAGSWTAEAAMLVAGRGAGESETLRLIAALVDKSLVQADLTRSQPRYGMLDVTRYYASERLPPRLLAETRSSLAQWLVRTYERAEADWPFMADADWAESYDPEIRNLRAGLSWAFGPDGDDTLGVRLTSFSEHVWSELSFASELRYWFDTALSRVTGETPPDVVGRLWLGRCGWLTLEDPQALAAARQAVALFRAAGSRIDLGRSLWRHGHQLLAGGHLDAAEPFLQEAGLVLRELRESKALVSWLRVRAMSRARRGSFDAALACLEEALMVARRIRSPRDVALALADMAEIRFAMGGVDRAIEAARDALASLDGVRNGSGWAQPITGALASYLIARGDIGNARPLVTARLHSARAMGLHHETVRGLERLGLIAALEGDIAFAALSLGHSAGYHESTSLLRSFSAQHMHERLSDLVGRALAPGDIARLTAEGAGLTADHLLHRAGLLPRGG